MSKGEYLYQELLKTIAQLLPLPFPRIAVGVSGGSDSMALILLAKRWAREHQIELIALTVDHRIRPQSALEARQVEVWMKHHDINHAILTWSQSVPVANLQHEARIMRYQLLMNYCTIHNIPCLWLAHHLQDQAETVISRLMRGSGVDGLTAMQPMTRQGDKMLCRPLLYCMPNQLRAMLCEENQKWIEDPSNQDMRFERVRIRRWLDDLPHKDVLLGRLSKTAQHMARARDFIEQEVDRVFSQIVHVKSDGDAVLNHVAFNTLHPELALRLMIRIMRLVSGKVYKPRFSTLETLYDALRHPSYSGATLGSCLWSKSKNGNIIIAPEHEG